MKTFLSRYLDRAALPETRPDESFFSAGPVRNAVRQAQAPSRALRPVHGHRQRGQHLGRHRHA
jgi:hypothetical protein